MPLQNAYFPPFDYFPKALLCCDSFHIIKNIHNILRNERIKVMRKYDEHSNEYYLSKKINYLLMMDSSKIRENKSKYNKNCNDISITFSYWNLYWI